jgi:hypothetical protein
MAVVFAQPEPMAPEIQKQGGQAEVMTKDFPTIASMYEAANRNALAASTASAANATHANVAGAQIAAQSSMAADQLGQRRYEFDRSQGVSDRDNWMANVQAASAQQHAALQAWVQGQEMSQSEVMQRQRLQNGLAGLQEALANGTIDQQDFDNGAMMLKTHLDPLNLKMQTQVQKAQAQQKQQALDAEAQGMSIEQLHAQQRAKDFEKGVIKRDDGSEWYLDPKGALHPLNDVANGMLGKGGKEQPSLDENGLTLKEHNAERAKAVKAANDFIASAEAAAPNAAKATPEDRLAMQQRFMKEMYGRDLDWKPAKGRNPQSEGTVSGDATGQGATDTNSGENAPGGPPVQPDIAQAAVNPQSLKAFDWTKPDTMHPLQKQQIDTFNAARADISGRSDIPEKDRWAAEDAITMAKELLGRWGSFANMPPEEKEKFNEAKKTYRAIPHRPYASSAGLYSPPSSSRVSIPGWR